MLEILVTCRGNSCRSILGEALFNHLGKNRLCAYSAGLQPKGKINSHMLAVLEQHQIPTHSLQSKPLSAIQHHHFDIAISVCQDDDDVCCSINRVVDAKVYVNWHLFEPSHCNEAEYPAPYALAYDIFEQRINTLLLLPLETMNSEQLKQHLHQIGQKTRYE